MWRSLRITYLNNSIPGNYPAMPLLYQLFTKLSAYVNAPNTGKKRPQLINYIPRQGSRDHDKGVEIN